MKKVTIQVPDGKRAEWINGVLTLVDEPKVGNRPITERIKTFEDACKELGDKHPFVVNYKNMLSVATREEFMTDGWGADFVAYAKLRIIIAALNDGWEPKFEKGEYRYYPWFGIYTQEEYDKLGEEEKGRCVLRSGSHTGAHYGLVYVGANYDSSFSYTSIGSRLVFRTRELAAYAGRQFFEEWADFMFKPRTGEELNGKSEETIDFNDNEDE